MEKKIRKNPIKFKISLNEEQRQAKGIIYNNDVTILTGLAGSGKSLLAAQVALDMLFTGSIGKIIITRPTVTAGEDLGYMPGGIDEKLEPYMNGILNHMSTLTDLNKLESLNEEGKIEIVPLGFMRGRNFSDVLVVVEEAQNITHSQMELLLSRMCKESKMILTGDINQIDLKDKKNSGFAFACRFLIEVDGFALVELKTNHRHPIVAKILEVYKQHEL